MRVRSRLKPFVFLSLALLWSGVMWAQKAKKEAPAAAPAAEPSGSPGYRIGPGDVLQISVYKEPEASVPEATVRTDGKISLPFLGEVEVQNLTPSEVEKTLTGRLTRFIKEPVVAVLVKSVQSEKVFVIGEVKKGGPIRLAGSMTVLEALSEASLDDFANRNKIYVLRTEGGKKVKLPFRYKDVINGKHPEQNIMLKPGDTIVVP